MASEANNLRQLAADLRKQAAVLEHDKMEKVARLLTAATGLTLLRSKVTHGR